MENLEKQIDSLGIVELQVEGSSMSPFLNDGDSVVAVNSQINDFRKGDLVIFSSGSGIGIHRVISFPNKKNSEPMILTAGDSRVTTDLPIGADDVIGRVLFIKCKDGRIVDLSNWKSRIKSRIIAFLSSRCASSANQKNHSNCVALFISRIRFWVTKALKYL